jgi:hypothetical protein
MSPITIIHGHTYNADLIDPAADGVSVFEQDGFTFVMINDHGTCTAVNLDDAGLNAFCLALAPIVEARNARGQAWAGLMLQ